MDRTFPTDIAEIQGLYGAFTFPEKLLQKIWLRREFDVGGARTVEWQKVRVLHPGRWNLLGGPDFHSARLRFDDGPEVTVDVELHLRAADWDLHGHARDAAYANVGLHVVLFWPDAGTCTRGGDGRTIPVLPLLPLLHHDLEEYAAEEVVELLANRPTARLTTELAAFPPERLQSLLLAQALSRWGQKVHFARLRLNRLGWDMACHHAALEVLGFRFNRPPMLRIATRWPLSAWCSGSVAIEDAYSSEAEGWSVQGVRPANHPRTRLRQYGTWAAACPNWTARWAELAARFPAIPIAHETRSARRDFRFLCWREAVARDVCAGTVGGSRLENLICDALLPLAAARGGVPDLSGPWFHWFCGDIPSYVVMGLRQLGICDGRTQPACHGLAQGLLGWLIEREVRR